MEAQIQTINPEIRQSVEILLATVDKTRSIDTVDNYRFAQGLMADVKARIKMLEEERMAQTRPLDESKKRIIEFFKPHLDRLTKAKDYLNNIMVKWTEEQEAKRREEERRLQEEARKRAEEEALRAALEAEAAGEKQEAEQILNEPVYVPPIKVMSEIPKSKESHIRETWSAELVSLKELVEGIVSGKAPLLAVKADMTFLNEQARAYRQALRIAGVRAVSKKTQI